MSFGASINADFLFIYYFLYGQLLVVATSSLDVPVQCMLRCCMLHFWTNKFIPSFLHTELTQLNLSIKQQMVFPGTG